MLARHRPTAKYSPPYLYELEQYTDAEIVRKKLAAMITGFITQASPDNPIIPPDQYQNAASQTEPGTQIGGSTWTGLCSGRRQTWRRS